MKKTLPTLLISLLILGVFFRLCFGFFVIQPIGMLPEGKTIVYWRAGLDYPFVTSPDGIQLDRLNKVSLFGRLGAIAGFMDNAEERIILRLPYSKSLYLMSTGGREFES